MIRAFIPARGGSKSISKKNIKNINGKPLIYWNLVSLQDCEHVDEVYVSTDCNLIKTTVESFNFSKVIVVGRSKEVSTDVASTEQTLLEFLSTKSFDEKDLLLLVQATSPFTTSSDFTKAIDQYRQSNVDSMLSCAESKRFYWSFDGSPINYNVTQRPRRQDFKGQLIENGAFYISSIGAIVDSKCRLSGKIGIYTMEEYTALEIDEPDDWIVAERLMAKYRPNSIRPQVKAFFSDVDGTLTDSGMYYDQEGNELKKFNTRDGKGFELLRNQGIKTGIITSEDTSIVTKRAKKLSVDYLRQGASGLGKLDYVKSICKELSIDIQEVAYIGDDINCIELLSGAGYAACPSDAHEQVKKVSGINLLKSKGGQGAVREFVDMILGQ